MKTYTVTTEIKTRWWIKLLRFFGIKSRREEFKLLVNAENIKKGTILYTGNNERVKVL